MTRRLAPLALALALTAACASNGPPTDPAAVALAYAAAGRHEAASREIELAVRAQPDNPALRRHAAGIEADAGDLAKAVEHLEVAIRLDASAAESWIALGQVETRRGNPSDAYVAYRRAAELAPDDLRAVSGLALAADSLGFDEEADRAYSRWAELEQASAPKAPTPRAR